MYNQSAIINYGDARNPELLGGYFAALSGDFLST